MRIRPFVQHDLARLVDLTIETFRPFYEDHFRPAVGDVVFANQHGNWRGDYRTQVAVSAAHRRHHAGTALCEHAFGQMRALGAEVVEIGTGGDPFHAPARALYERLGCTPVPVAFYYRQL